jgi:hypothetical protein
MERPLDARSKHFRNELLQGKENNHAHQATELPPGYRKEVNSLRSILLDRQNWVICKGHPAASHKVRLVSFDMRYSNGQEGFLVPWSSWLNFGVFSVD